MTTEDGSSRSQAEVHERTQDDIFDADGKYVLDLLNHKFDTALSGYGIEGGTWEFVEDATAAMRTEVEHDEMLKNLIPIDPAYFYEKYNVPAPPTQTTGNLASVLGVGGLQGLQAIITDPNLTDDQKLNTLVVVFGIEEGQAKRIIFGNETTE